MPYSDAERRRSRWHSGGYFEITSASDLLGSFQRVAEELHHQYALRFTPETLDGKMHTLTVRVVTPGLSARARKSYLAKRTAT